MYPADRMGAAVNDRVCMAMFLTADATLYLTFYSLLGIVTSGMLFEVRHKPVASRYFQYFDAVVMVKSFMLITGMRSILSSGLWTPSSY